MFRAILLALFLSLSPVLARGEARFALVITNQPYTQPGAQLDNTYRDGQVIKAALERVGFKVWVVKDTVNKGMLRQAIGEHVQRLAEAEPDVVGFLYYSGHGAGDRPNGCNAAIVPPILAVFQTASSISAWGVPSLNLNLVSPPYPSRGSASPYSDRRPLAGSL
jgi:uncharacterized caspase-like protein